MPLYALLSKRLHFALRTVTTGMGSIQDIPRLYRSADVQDVLPHENLLDTHTIFFTLYSRVLGEQM